MTNPTVCILTSGTGSRLGFYTKKKNKSLLSLNKKSIISKIFENFPKNSEFIVSIGYKGKQVRDFIKIHHPDLNVKFVEVKNYRGKGSGPGTSLFKCKKYLQKSFFFVSCDTIWRKKIFNITNFDWMGSYSSKKINTKNFCNLISNKNNIYKIIDKKRVKKTNNSSIFVGLAFIKNYKLFWEGFKTKSFAEPQVSLGFNNILKRKVIKKINIDWEDTGTKKNYEDLIIKYEKYNFNKDNQQIYISKSKVTKYFADKNIVNKIYNKGVLKKKIFPSNFIKKNNFISYDYIEGSTLYNYYNKNSLKLLLNFLENNLWNEKIKKSNSFKNICRDFYFNKTINRVRTFKKKYKYLDINNLNFKKKKILKIKDIFRKIDWNYISDGTPKFIHGDLQFDNILFTNNKKFKLIDWRPNFGKSNIIGDQYYDFAKLLGGLEINYDLIKKNKFSLRLYNNNIFMKIPKRKKTKDLINFFENYLIKNGYNLLKVKIITGLIFLNMSPLHKEPFDKLLFFFGKYYLQKNLGLLKNAN